MPRELTAAQEAQLAQIAAEESNSRHELARHLPGRAIAPEADFIAAVNAGIESAGRGDFVQSTRLIS